MTDFQKPATEEELQALGSVRLNLFFRLAMLAAIAFVISIFAMVAVMFSGEDTALTRFFDEYGIALVLGEAGLTLALTICALTFDRTKVLRNELAALRREQTETKATPDDSQPGRDETTADS